MQSLGHIVRQLIPPDVTTSSLNFDHSMLSNLLETLVPRPFRLWETDLVVDSQSFIHKALVSEADKAIVVAHVDNVVILDK